MTRHRPRRDSGSSTRFSALHERHFRPHERQQHVALVQDAIEAQVVEQRARHAAGFAREIYRRARDAMRRFALDQREKVAHRHLFLGDQPIERAPSFLPRRHQHVRQHRDGDRQPAAVVELQQVRQEERELDQRDEAEHGHHRAVDAAPAPHAQQHDHEDAVDEHRAGDRDAVRAGERARGLEHDDQRHRAGEQQPVQRRHVHLADLFFRGMQRRAAAADSRD